MFEHLSGSNLSCGLDFCGLVVKSHISHGSMPSVNKEPWCTPCVCLSMLVKTIPTHICDNPLFFLLLASDLSNVGSLPPFQWPDQWAGGGRAAKPMPARALRDCCGVAWTHVTPNHHRTLHLDPEKAQGLGRMFRKVLAEERLAGGQAHRCTGTGALPCHGRAFRDLYICAWFVRALGSIAFNVATTKSQACAACTYTFGHSKKYPIGYNGVT